MTNLSSQFLVDKILRAQEAMRAIEKELHTPARVYLNPLLCKLRCIRRSRRKRQDKKLTKKHGPQMMCCSHDVLQVKGMGLFMCEHMIKKFRKQVGLKNTQPGGRWVG